MDPIIIYILLGVCSGFLAGLLGIGGGIIIVPGLIYIFMRQGVSTDQVTHLAIGTSLASISFTAFASTYMHHRKAAVLWSVFARFVPGILVGSLLGALFAGYLRGQTLMVIFGVILIILALKMLLNIEPKTTRALPSGYKMPIAGGIIGWISALAGVGGGSMITPFLVWCQTPIRNAVATSAACGFPLAIAAMTGFIISGWGQSHLPTWSTGFVYWPACFGIAIASMVSAVLGANMTYVLPVKTIRHIFAIFLTIVGIQITYAGLTFSS